MPRARRTLTDTDILELVVHSRDARRLRTDGPERRANSIANMATFLWLAGIATALAVGISLAWDLESGAKENCNHRANAGGHIECAQAGKSKRMGRGGIEHAGILILSDLAKHVRGGLS